MQAALPGTLRCAPTHWPFITLSGMLLKIFHQRHYDIICASSFKLQLWRHHFPNETRRGQQWAEGVTGRKPAPQEDCSEGCYLGLTTTLHGSYQHIRVNDGSLLVKMVASESS